MTTEVTKDYQTLEKRIETCCHGFNNWWRERLFNKGFLMPTVISTRILPLCSNSYGYSKINVISHATKEGKILNQT